MIEDIKDVYYTPLANNGQGAALVISLKGNKEKIFPVRLYGKDKTDNIILILTKRLEKKNGVDLDVTSNGPYGDIKNTDTNAITEANKYRDAVNEPKRLWYRWYEDYLSHHER